MFGPGSKKVLGPPLVCTPLPSHPGKEIQDCIERVAMNLVDGKEGPPES